MKSIRKWFNTPKTMFTLLMAVCVAAMALGAYLAAAVGVGSALQGNAGPMGLMIVLCAVCLGLWIRAWGAFCGLCAFLRNGKTAFCERSARALRVIRFCMAWMCALTVLMGCLAGRGGLFGVMECAVLPGVFGGAALAAWVLLAMLGHAAWLEKEMEDVV